MKFKEIQKMAGGSLGFFDRVALGAMTVIESAASGISNISDNIINSEKKIVHKTIKEESLTCTSEGCNCLAVPLYTTINKYKCTSCDRQFADADHKIKYTIESKFNGNDKEEIYGSCVEDLVLLQKNNK